MQAVVSFFLNVTKWLIYSHLRAVVGSYHKKVFRVAIFLISLSPDAARIRTRGELAPHVAPLHDGGLSDLAVDEKVVEGKRSQRGYTSCDQLEVASLEKVAGSNQRSSF